jgi:SSS family solute:Na+ symporter
MTALVIFGFYLLALFALGWLARTRMVSRSPHDFYLAGGTLGLVVLFFTLFATQYSGNTFLGFPGEAYRKGYAYIVSVTFMMAIVAGYLLYAPRLRRVCVEHRFITPCDWIHHRYEYLPLTLFAALLMTWSLLNFLLAQLVAIGHAFAGLTDGRVPYEAGVLLLALVIVIYETVGGMRAVAWTDVVQGGLMFVAIAVLAGCFLGQGGEWTTTPERIAATHPEKVAPPDFTRCLTWASSIVLVGLGGAMYPQGIQRLYAAASDRALRRGLALMVFMPLLATLLAFAVGILAIVEFPGLAAVESDKVMPQMLNLLAAQGLVQHVAVTVLLVGALAAIMSTADSCLLSLSSILVQDFYAKTAGQDVSETRLLRLGKITSWALIGVLVWIAMRPDFTLWRLLEIKFELLIQTAPAFVLGFYLPNLTGRVALLGMALGCTVAMIGFMGGDVKWAGLHPGTVGCIVNFLVCWIGAGTKRAE